MATVGDEQLVTVGAFRDVLAAVLRQALSPIYERLDQIEARMATIEKGQQALAEAHGSFATKVLALLSEER